MSSEPDGPTAPEESSGGTRPTAVVRGHVLPALGRPPGLYRVTVVSLWLKHYRVNVLVGPNPSTVEIPHSYFVEADGTGHVLTATPLLTKIYP